jgi:hypothetical protein
LRLAIFPVIRCPHHHYFPADISAFTAKPFVYSSMCHVSYVLKFPVCVFLNLGFLRSGGLRVMKRLSFSSHGLYDVGSAALRSLAQSRFRYRYARSFESETSGGAPCQWKKRCDHFQQLFATHFIVHRQEMSVKLAPLHHAKRGRRCSSNAVDGALAAVDFLLPRYGCTLGATFPSVPAGFGFIDACAKKQ